MHSLAAFPLLTIAGIALCSACAARSAKPSTCDPLPAEFALAGQMVYRACDVDRHARPVAPLPRLAYTPAPGQRCGWAEIDVVVDSTGRPVQETARIVRATDASFGLAVLGSIANWRYAPAMKDGRPVAQLARVAQGFNVVAVPAGTPPSSIRPPRRPPPC